MLREIKHVKQNEGEPGRRWFMSPYFDLIVWFSDSEEIDGFELCYGKTGVEKALCWHQQGRYSHQKVDTGESEPLKYKKAPIYVPDGVFDKQQVLERFNREASNIERSIKKYVAKKISEFDLQN